MRALLGIVIAAVILAGCGSASTAGSVKPDTRGSQSDQPTTLPPPSFTVPKGWKTGASSESDEPGEQTFAWASSAPFFDAAFSAPPMRTLDAMAPKDVLVEVFLWRPSPDDQDQAIHDPALPITLDPSANGQDYPGGTGSRWFQRRSGRVGDRQIDVWVFAGRADPPPAQIAEAQHVIDQMTLPHWPPPSSN
jgi:hypothetical protein